jgi:hypothetical protein
MSERHIVRGFASGALHLADMPAETVQDLVFFGVPCLGSLEPVAALCRTTVGRGSGVVIMREGSRVTCSLCRRIAAARPVPAVSAAQPEE